MGALIARHVGARHIVITEISEYRIRLAKKVGIQHVINVAKANLRDVMKQLEMTEGFDVGLEMSGNPKAFHQMIDAMIHGGKMALLGILPDGVGIDWTQVIFKSLFLKGIYGREMYETWYKMTSMLQSGLDISGVITHKFPAEKFQEAFDAMSAQEAGKIILEWD